MAFSFPELFQKKLTFCSPVGAPPKQHSLYISNSVVADGLMGSYRYFTPSNKINIIFTAADCSVIL